MNTWIEGLTFAQRQRLQFIEAMLIWSDAVQRKDVCDVFNITPNHLTRDIKQYRTFNKGALEYDVETRSYRKGIKFKPFLASGSASEYLTLLQAYSLSHVSAIIPAIGHIANAEALPIPSGEIDIEVLKSVVQAIKNSTGIEVLYQSLKEALPIKRSIWPHTLVFTGDRWHVRAYDELKLGFRDFVLTRILKSEPLDTVLINKSDDDVLWNEYELIQIIPAAGLSESQKTVIGKEYGMTLNHLHSLTWSAEIRKCLIGYFLIRNRLEYGGNFDGKGMNGQHPNLALSDPKLADQYRFVSDQR